MLAGIAGMSLALLGLPSPVLTSLLLVGIGADADIARRAAIYADLGVGRLAASLRGIHALLYAALYCFAWGSMLDAAESSAGHLFLTFDLCLSGMILFFFARRRAA